MESVDIRELQAHLSETVEGQMEGAFLESGVQLPERLDANL